MKYIVQFLLLIAAVSCFAQAPVINDVQPVTAGPNQKIVITGNGFDATAANNLVWFDHVKGTVTAASIYSLEVQVPAQARFTNVEVLNLTTKLSGKSKVKFLPSYGGASLDITKLTQVTPVGAPYTDTNDMFDVVSCDVDLDGKPDLITSKGGPASTASITDLYIFKNASTGIGNINFTRTPITLTLGGPTVNIACGDLNGDGKPEILASRGGNTRNEVFILRNTNATPGTISFAASTKILLDPGEFAFRMAISDLNGDGKPEVIVSNAHDDLNTSTSNQIYVFVNQSTSGGAISFASPVRLTVTGADSTYGLDVQDIDGDTKADIIVNQFQKQDIFIFRNTSTGSLTFDAVMKLPASGAFIQITSSDLNNDGKLDLIGTSIGTGAVAGDQNIQYWINQSTVGNISFSGSQTLTTSKGPWAVDVSDIDGDGDADMIVTNKAISPFDASDIKINIFRQDSPLNFTKLDIVTANPQRNLRVGDFDGDAKPDIAFTAFPSSGLTYSLNVIRNSNCWQPAITSPSNQICTGQTVRLSAKPALGVTFNWTKDGSSVQTSAQEYFDATAAGTYKVTVTGTFDTGCALASSDFVLAQNNNAFPTDPTINNNVPCSGAALNLSTPTVATASYAWAGPSGFTSTNQNPTISSVTDKNGGAYTLQLTLANGCKSNIITKILDVASVPVLPIAASPSLNGCTGGSITLSVSGSGFTFQWNKGGVAIGGQTGSSLALTSLAAASEGDYSVTVTSIANTCSQETGKATVKVLSAPTVNFTTTGPLCKGSVITFNDQSTGDSRGTLTYQWNFDGTNTSTQQNPTFTYNTPNSYNPSLQVSYGGACAVSTSKSLTIVNATVPAILSTANPICTGDQTTLSVSGTFSTYTWTGVTGSTSSVVITQAGVYGVNTVDASGCTGTATLTITLKPSITPFVASAKRLTISAGDTTQLNATAGADTYAWTPIETLNNPAIANPIAKPTVTTDYIVIAKKAGSCDASDTVTVAVQLSGDVIKPPKVFSPNGDGKNDCWLLCQTTDGSCSTCIEETLYGDYTMTIYDGHGSQIIQQKGFKSWDGNYNGKAAPDGTYYFVFSNSKDKPTTGSVLLVR